MEMIRGSCDDDATGGEGFGVFLGNGGISHGRGMRSSEDGAVFLTSGNGLSSCHSVAGTNMGRDGGSSILTGSGVSSIGTGSWYCSIDKYSCRCNRQGTRGSGGDSIWGGNSPRGGLGINGGTTGAGITGGRGTFS